MLMSVLLTIMEGVIKTVQTLLEVMYVLVLMDIT